MNIKFASLGLAGFLSATGCFSEKGTVAADTASASSTSLVAPDDSPVSTNSDTVIGWDSVIKPRAAIDTTGNVQPIRRDSL